jgi:cysteinyl-tRNA synthetase
VLRAGGKNRVLSYLNLGACERFRTYWTSAPAGFVPCGKNTAAKLGAYDGYPDETWMDPSNAEYRRLIVDHVAARIAARGVDGFYLDNLELLSHAPNDENGPCSAACRQGGLDLVRELRTRYPALVLVMQNGTGPVTRLGTTGGVRFATLLDGIAHEEVWKPAPDPEAEAELVAWRDLGLRNGQGTPFWIGTVDYVGGCNQVAAAREVFDKSRARGFSPWVSDASDKQQVVCRWPF